ncbi:MAG: YbaB/EbfC family nucleoid-associated protein [Candidatus Ancaeobacter aquaticus]|nr:YbaB/EbfC family nucleoid-associated protein [Candidatus Ancaeobacter aquaticus]
MAGMADMMKDAFKMRGEMKKVQKVLGQIEAEGNASGVKVKATGDQKITSIEIDESLLVAGNAKKIGEQVKTATNIALNGAKKIAQNEMKSMTGINLPGFGG